MATTDFKWARFPINADGTIVVKNTDGSNNFVAGNCVTLDASNPLSGTQPSPGCVLSASGDLAFGVVVESIAMGAYGRVQIEGIVQVVASGAITANTCVETDTGGKVKTCASAAAQIGQALTPTSSNGDLLLMRIALARNS